MRLLREFRMFKVAVDGLFVPKVTPTILERLRQTPIGNHQVDRRGALAVQFAQVPNAVIALRGAVFEFFLCHCFSDKKLPYINMSGFA